MRPKRGTQLKYQHKLYHENGYVILCINPILMGTGRLSLYVIDTDYLT